MWEAIERNERRSWLLILALAAILLGLGSLVGGQVLSEDGAVWGTIAAAGAALILFLLAWSQSDRLVLAAAGAVVLRKEDSPRLFNLVEEMAIAAGLSPLPRVCIIEDDAPNAFAIGSRPERAAVAVTTGMLSRLDRDELQGVVAHEIAHIRNRDILVSTVAACLAGAIGYAAHALGFLGLGARHSDDEGAHGSPLAGIAVMLLAPIAAMLIQLGISRAREYLADETGARLAGDPLALASALGRLEHAAEAVPSWAAQPATASLYIVNPFTGGARLFSTHPSTAERVARLQALAGTGAVA